MQPIVHGLKDKYSSCMRVERATFHQHTPWHDLILPLASPEFALLDPSLKIIYRWFGVIDEEDFAVILDPLCSG